MRFKSHSLTDMSNLLLLLYENETRNDRHIFTFLFHSRFIAQNVINLNAQIYVTYCNKLIDACQRKSM